MGAELEIRRSDKECLFQIMKARHESANPGDFKDLLAWAKSRMDQDDIKVVMQEFEEWKDS